MISVKGGGGIEKKRSTKKMRNSYKLEDVCADVVFLGV